MHAAATGRSIAGLRGGDPDVCPAALHAAGAVDPSTLDNKVLIGYQGWFTCPSDGSQRWTHWSRGVPSAETLTVELYPDLSELDADERCEIPGMTIGGKPAYLFSSRNQKTVSRHFRWMKEYGLDGVLVQRFVGRDPAEARRRRRGAQEHHGGRKGIGPDVRHRVRHLGRKRRDVRADIEGRLGVPGGRTEGDFAPELSAPQRKAGGVRSGAWA